MAKNTKASGQASDLTVLAFEAVRWMGRSWFAHAINPAPDRFMALLLMSVYAFDGEKRPLHKKAAWKIMGVQEVKTGRKYISAAQEAGFIEVRQSAEDKRKELLFPTEQLKSIVEAELTDFTRQMPCIAAEDATPRSEGFFTDNRIVIRVAPLNIGDLYVSRVPCVKLGIFGPLPRGSQEDWQELSKRLAELRVEVFRGDKKRGGDKKRTSAAKLPRPKRRDVKRPPTIVGG